MPERPHQWVDGTTMSHATDDNGGTAEVGIEHNYVWDPVGLAWTRMTQPGGGSGGGGAVTVADGADVAQGHIADAAWVSGSGTVISLLKKIASAGGSAVSIADGSDVAQGTTTDLSSANTVIGILKAIKAAITGTVAVSGTFWQATQPVSGTFWQATQPVSGTVAATQSGTWTVQPGNTANTTAWKVDGSGVTQPVSGTVTANANQAGTWTVQPGNTANTTAWKVDGSAVTQPVSVAASLKVNVEPETSGGLTINRVISAATTNGTSVKASAGQVYLIVVGNINASPRYLKLYNKASAPTVGTDTPVATFTIPGNTAGAGFVIPIEAGFAFATGIALAITGGITDADTTATSANEVTCNLFYK